MELTKMDMQEYNKIKDALDQCKEDILKSFEMAKIKIDEIVIDTPNFGDVGQVDGHDEYDAKVDRENN